MSGIPIEQLGTTFDIDFDIDAAVQQATDFIDNKTINNTSYLVDNCNQMMDVANSVEKIVTGGFDTVISSSTQDIITQAKDFAVDTAVDQVTTFLGNSDTPSFINDNVTSVMGHMTAVDGLISLPASIPSLPSIGELSNVFNTGKTLAVNTVISQATSFASDAIGSALPANANSILNAIGGVQKLSIPTSLSIDPVSIASAIFPAKTKAVTTAIRNVSSLTKSLSSVQFMIGNPNAIFSALDSVEALLAAGIDISELGFPMDLLNQGKQIAQQATSAISSVSSVISSIGGFF